MKREYKELVEKIIKIAPSIGLYDEFEYIPEWLWNALSAPGVNLESYYRINGHWQRGRSDTSPGARPEYLSNIRKSYLSELHQSYYAVDPERKKNIVQTVLEMSLRHAKTQHISTKAALRTIIPYQYHRYFKEFIE